MGRMARKRKNAARWWTGPVPCNEPGYHFRSIRQFVKWLLDRPLVETNRELIERIKVAATDGNGREPRFGAQQLANLKSQYRQGLLPGQDPGLAPYVVREP